MPQPTPPYDVVHHPDLCRFEVSTAGAPAVLTYALTSRGVVFEHTVVPAEAEGLGVGGALVRTALDWARAERLDVTPQCSFVRAWLTRHPDHPTG